MPVTVKILGLKELEQKLDGSFLVQPEIEPALDSVANRGKRGGKGLGAKRNPITVRESALTRDLISSLHNPRQTGRTWRDSNIRRFLPPVARNALNKAAKNIMARFGA